MKKLLSLVICGTIFFILAVGSMGATIIAVGPGERIQDAIDSAFQGIPFM